MKVAILLFIIALSPLLSQAAFGQLPQQGDSLSLGVGPDSLGAILSTTPGKLTSQQLDTLPGTYRAIKSPFLAVVLSALVPGAGQAYNESYWKIPIVLGFGVYFGSQWLHNNRLYKDYRDRYRESLKNGSAGNPIYYRLREFYKEQRDTFTWYFAILYFLNVLDAYVDASLYDFNVGSDLSIRVLPERGTRIGVQIRF